jgi:hypothetical protein
MNYVVQAPGVPAFAGEQVFEVWTTQWPNPGDDLPVVFDPRQPETLKIPMGSAHVARRFRETARRATRGPAVPVRSDVGYVHDVGPSQQT